LSFVRFRKRFDIVRRGARDHRLAGMPNKHTSPAAFADAKLQATKI
jgi:hypothetical protein